MSQLSVLLQETARSETEEVRTILGLLREHIMDDEGGTTTTTTTTTSSTTFKERLIGFRGGFGCCGATWIFRSTGGGGTIRNDDDEQKIIESNRVDPAAAEASNSNSGMNLAAALAAERQFREANYVNEELGGGGGGGGGNPVRVSLMRLLEETEAATAAAVGDLQSEKLGRERDQGNDTVCCVCMVRKKGAALIPCGHTYCRVCSREVWVNRGKCPLCNRSILEILDIF